jgi:hypothetical protein
MIRSIKELIPKDYILVEVYKSIHKSLTLMFINGDSKTIGVKYSIIRLDILKDYIQIDAYAVHIDILKNLKNFFDFIGFKDNIAIFYYPDKIKATELHNHSRVSNMRLIGRYIKRVNKT